MQQGLRALDVEVLVEDRNLNGSALTNLSETSPERMGWPLRSSLAGSDPSWSFSFARSTQKIEGL